MYTIVIQLCIAGQPAGVDQHCAAIWQLVGSTNIGLHDYYCNRNATSTKAMYGICEITKNICIWTFWSLKINCCWSIPNQILFCVIFSVINFIHFNMKNFNIYKKKLLFIIIFFEQYRQDSPFWLIWVIFLIVLK